MMYILSSHIVLILLCNQCKIIGILISC